MIARLDAVAARLGHTRAGIVKVCLTAFLEKFEKEGKAALPLDWEEVLQSLDGRSLGLGGPRRKVSSAPIDREKLRKEIEDLREEVARRGVQMHSKTSTGEDAPRIRRARPRTGGVQQG